MAKLALGTVQFGLNYGISNQRGKVSPSEAANILAFAQANNITTLDTASAYGASEKVLGESLNQSINDFQIVTKIIPATDTIYAQVDESLIRLQTESVYAIMLHNAEDLLGGMGNRYFEQLLKLKEKGKIQKIGVSVYTPEQFFQIIKMYKVDLVQVPMNVFDQRFCTAEFKQAVSKNSIEVHARSVFLQGLLLMKAGTWPDYFKPFTTPLWAFHDFVSANHLSPIEACLAFAKSQDHIAKFVVGVNAKSELEEIVQRFNKLPALDFSGLSQSNEQLINPANWS